MKAYLYRIGFAFYATLIAALSLVNIGAAPGLPRFFDGFDKVVHFCFYLGFSVLLGQAFLEAFSELKTKTLPTVLYLSGRGKLKKSHTPHPPSLLKHRQLREKLLSHLLP